MEFLGLSADTSQRRGNGLRIDRRKDGAIKPKKAKLSSGKRVTRLKRTAARIKAILRHSALTGTPIWLSGGRLSEPHPNKLPVHVERTIVIPHMPDAFDGLRIVHLSDMHIGQLITPAHLPGIIENCKKLNGDMIAITGDYIDLSQSVLDDVISAIKLLDAPLGVHLVPGNHDYLENGPRLVRRFRNAGMGLMLNTSRVIEHRNKRILIAGVDYAHHRLERDQYVRQVMTQARGQGQFDLNLLLAHHPDAFDEACRQGVDVTLSGHTHGGQVILKHTKGARGSIGLGAMAFKYPRGLYQRGHRHLHVTSGVGSWFPLRVQCPSEIVTLTLRTDGQTQ